jgi:hypothetical protein
MKLIHALSFLALALTIVPPILSATGQLGDGPMKLTMLIGAVLWFATAPKWLHGGES